MNLAFLLHIYQPSNQSDRIVKDISESSYIPLIKLIKKTLNLNITLNIPLSLSHKLHENKIDSVISDIRNLSESGKVELTSTGAYHPILSKIPANLVEKEILLNEFGLGYYYGKRKGFEGEDAIMLKNVCGFFPPEMSINMELLSHLDSLGYRWVAIDRNSLELPDSSLKNIVLGFENLDIQAVVRNTELSNILSFKRNMDVDDFIDVVLSLRQDGKDALVALDGEMFGHHYSEGLILLESLLAKLTSLEINLTTVSELVERSNVSQNTKLVDSSWGASKEELEEGNMYPLWDAPGNALHKELWELLFEIASVETGSYKNNNDPLEHGLVLETLPLWDTEKLDEIKDVVLKNEIYKEILQLQCMNSDQFWWASKHAVGGDAMYSPEYIRNALDLYKKFSMISENSDLMTFVQKKIEKIETLL
ncbi:hypothetical protein ACFL0C_00500 [Patescibacteria group bacterium]